MEEVLRTPAGLAALIKFTSPCNFAQSIQLSNIVLAGFHQQAPPRRVWIALQSIRYHIGRFHFQPNVRRQATFSNRIRNRLLR